MSNQWQVASGKWQVKTETWRVASGKWQVLPLICLVFALVSTARAATTFTATQSGDWNTPSTWGNTGTAACHTNIPCSSDTTAPNGDLVVMSDAFTITCTGASEVCSAGDSTADTADVAISVTHTGSDVGGITIGGTATLVYAGHVNWAGGTFAVNAGGIVVCDSTWNSAPTTVGYGWSMNHTGTPTIGAGFSMVGTSGSPINWYGDSFYSPRKQAGICAANTCYSGSIGTTTADSRADQGWGTFTYVNWTGVGQPTANSYYLNYKNQTTTLSNVAWLYCSTVKFQLEGSSGTASIAANGFQILYTRSTSTSTGAFSISSNGNTGPSGAMSMTNGIVDYVWNITSSTAKAWTFRNIFLYTSQANINPGRHPGFQSLDGSTYDQIFAFNNASSDDAALYSAVMTNSVLWTERMSTGGVNVHPYNGSWASTAASGIMNFTNNVLDGLGYVSANNTTVNFGIGGNPGVATTALWSGNVTSCGAIGKGASNFPIIDNTAVSNVTLSLANNTDCAYNVTLSTDAFDNTLGAESVTIPSATVTNIDSNLYHREDGNGVGPIAEVCDGTGSGYTGIIALLESNAVVNTSTGASAICSQVTTWVTTGPQNDVIIQNRPPVLVEPGRSLPLFDTEYAIPAGLWTLASYSAAAWTSGNAYTVGNVVSDAQSGIYSGKSTYWRCIVANTASSTNRPVSGTSGSVGFWEPASIAPIKAAILAGTTYTDGAVNASGAYMVGLINAWLRQGTTSMEPTLWNGCLNHAECGAVQLAAIRHLPPPAMVN